MVFNTSCAPLNYKASHEPETFDAPVVVDAVLLCGFAASASGCDRLGDYPLPGTLQKRNSSHALDTLAMITPLALLGPCARPQKIHHVH